MTKNDEDNATILAAATVLVSIPSMIGCIYVCLSAVQQGYRPCPRLLYKMNPSLKHDDYELRRVSPFGRMSLDESIIMTDVIFWMCITDSLHELQLCLTFIPQIFVDGGVWFYDKNGVWCNIISICEVFLSIQSPLWHMILSYRLFWLLKGYSMETLEKQKLCHYVLVFAIPAIYTVFSVVYKTSGTIDLYKNILDCWVVDESWGLIEYVFILLCLVSHFLVVWYVLYKRKKSLHPRKQSLHIRYSKITKNYRRFVVVYSIIWIIPSVYGVFIIFGYSLQLFHYIVVLAVASPGIANGILWQYNKAKKISDDVLLVNNTNNTDSTQVTSKNDHGPHSNMTQYQTITMSSKNGQMS
mmetsp:Transcript_13308/g.16430  ORF Transcript_13308/g.16430 Transcript_13308/m.16430 type:complete len:355 (+) Transcript_13308:1532-2596(+)